MIWISGKRAADADLLTVPPTNPAWETDDLVREYENVAELIAHVKGHVDHLGHVPSPPAIAGTWVRFNPEGVNILGEYHTHTRLLDLVAPLGIGKWVDESFFCEQIADDSHVGPVYVVENGNALTGRGITVSAAELHLHGVESLFPKLAFPLPQTAAYLDGTIPAGSLGNGHLIGLAAGFSLKLLWAHAKDLAEGRTTVVPTGATARKREPSAADKALAAVVLKDDGLLDKFITGIPVGGYLGDSVTPGADQVLTAKLRELVAALIAAMFARLADDFKLGQIDRMSLERKPRATTANQEGVFNEWRNLRFAVNIAEAVAQREVRYVGIGVYHLAYLIKNEKTPANAHLYDIRPQGAAHIADLSTLPATNTLTGMAARTLELKSRA